MPDLAGAAFLGAGAAFLGAGAAFLGAGATAFLGAGAAFLGKEKGEALAGAFDLRSLVPTFPNSAVVCILLKGRTREGGRGRGLGGEPSSRGLMRAERCPPAPPPAPPSADAAARERAKRPDAAAAAAAGGPAAVPGR